MDISRPKHIRYIRGKVPSLLLFLLLGTIYYILFQIFYIWIKLDFNVHFDGVKDFVCSIMFNYVPIMALTIINTLIIFYIPTRLKRIGYKIIQDVVLSFVGLSVVDMLFILITSMKVDVAGTVLSNVMLMLILEVIYYIKHLRQTMQREALAREETLRYQYAALKAQVSPHFLFNSLNILYSLTTIDIDKSREFIMALSQMYRYIMAQQEMHRAQLSEEIRFLRSYVHVLSMRYHGAFDVCIKGENLAEGHELIPYTLQLLVENVHKHNIITEDMPMHVTIEVTGKNVIISNPIRRKRTSSSTGIGLRYITELYLLHNVIVDIKDDGNTFTAIIPYI